MTPTAITTKFGPQIDVSAAAFVHPSALLYGKLRAAEGSSIWCNVVARSENYEIVIGPYSNIQDFTMIHIGAGSGTYIGSYCSITHHCTIHGCTIGDNCLIGINSTIMDGCVIGDNSIIGGHTFLKEGTVVPPNSIVTGTPGQVRRTENNYTRNRINALAYYRNALAYGKGDHRWWDRPEFAAEMTEAAGRFAREQALADGLQKK